MKMRLDIYILYMIQYICISNEDMIQVNHEKCPGVNFMHIWHIILE